MSELLGDVPYPTSPPDMDFRDAMDLEGAAIVEAAKRDADRFFGVLAREPSLLASSTVVSALGAISDARAVPLLLDVLRAGDSVVRWSAAHALVDKHDARILDGFVAAVGDRSKDVRAIVVEALGKMGDPRALDALRNAAPKKSNANDAYLRKLFDQAIRKLASRRAR
jgi:HEAT repeat protein